MKPRISGLGHVVTLALSLWAMELLLPPSTATAQSALVINPLVEKKVAKLPTGPLFWRIENFATVAEAQAVAAATGLVAQAEGKVWLFTLGAPGHASPGGSNVVEVGPLPEAIAKMQRPPTEYLLSVNEASGPPGSVTPMNMHPGTETIYVLAGETSERTPHGVTRVTAGQSMPGHRADMPMQILSSGTTDLRSLVMFVLDAAKPYSSSVMSQ